MRVVRGAFRSIIAGSALIIAAAGTGHAATTSNDNGLSPTGLSDRPDLG
jgi:hypothetical protein